MNIKNADRIFDEARKFFGNPNHLNPIIYLVAKDGKNFYSNAIPIAPSDDGSSLIETSVKTYLYNLENIMAESTVNNWDSSGPEEGISVKSFGSPENEFYKGIANFNPINNKKFLEKQYSRRYFNLELRLNDSESIHLHQAVTASYKTNWKKLQIKIFEDIEKIEVIDYNNS